MLLKLKFGFLESKNGSVKDKKVYNFDDEVGTYTGEIKNGDLHGQGELTLNQDGKVFSGKFTTNMLFTGKVNEKNSVYEGKLAAFKPNGEGIYHWKDVIEYHGAFNDGKYHGKGKKIRKKYLHQGLYALTVEGNFENGEPSGKCLAVYANGTVYDGEFVNGKRQGFGICKYKDGKGKNYDGSDCIDGHDYKGEEGFTYEGEWYQNKRHGKGKLKNAEGTIILEGIWENNQIKNNQIKNGTGTKIYDNGDVYDGEWKEGKHHGKGKYLFVDGSIYEGEWKDSLFSGQGVLKNAEGVIIADGIWDDNKLYTGIIIIDMNNNKMYFKELGFLKGDLFEGKMENGKLNGSGKLILVSGSIYEGDWKDGQRNGHGIMTWARDSSIYPVKKGYTYEGQWQKGLFSGEGVLKNEDDKVVVVGTWENNQIVKGRKVYDNGNVYDGDWKDGQSSGFGKFIWSDGNIYEGNFKDGNFHGIGKMTYANGDAYEGNWKDDNFHGIGKMTYANGDVYEGDWKDNNFHGIGKMTYANGDVYEGQMRDNKFFGQGVLKNAENELVAEGLWQNNECISLQIIKLSQEKEYKKIITIYEELAANEAFSENRKFFEEEIERYNMLLISQLTNNFSGNLTNDSTPQNLSKESNDDFDDFA
jgi:hypothetical protein